MTLVGIFWLILILFTFSKKFKYTIIATIPSIMFTGTAFYASETITISVFEMSALLLLFRYFVLKKGKIVLNKLNRCLFFMVFIFAAITLLDALIFRGYQIQLYAEWGGSVHPTGYDVLGINISTIIVLGRLFYYVLIFAVINSYSQQYLSNDELDFTVEHTFFLSLAIVLICGLIQWVTSLGIADFSRIVKLYHNVGYDAFTQNYDRLYSVFDEPSYCGPWLNAAFWSLIMMKNNKNKRINDRTYFIFLAATLIEFLLTLSGAGFVAFLITLSIWFLFVKKNKNLLIWIWTAIILGVFLLYFTAQGQIIVKMLATKLTSDSGTARIFYIFDCYSKFIETYGLGVGYGRLKCMTLISGLMGQVGIIGTIYFVYTLFLLLNRHVKCYGEILSKTFFISIVIGTEISCSGLQYCMTFWFGFFLYSLSISGKRRSLKDATI